MTRMIQESETIECKEILVDDVKKEVVAFANSHGGTIYIGIRDDGTVAGVQNVDVALQQAGNMVRDAVRPDATMSVHYDIETIDGKQVLAIRVQEGTNKPYYIAKNGLKPSGVYVRQGSSAAPASENAIRQMIKETDGDSFEKMRSLNQTLTFQYAKAEFARHLLPLEEKQMQTLGILDAAEQFTNVGLLLSDQCPFVTKCAVFSGCDQGEFQDRKEFGGSLLAQMEAAYDYIDLNNGLSATFDGLYRTDRHDYPQAAIRETLLNSLVHRDYSYSASTLISIYKDRLECVSIGGLLPGISLEDVLMGLSVCRNKNVADIFYRLNLIEAYGTGLQKIKNSYKADARQPEILAAPNSFKIILPNRNFVRQKAANTARANDAAVLEYAGAHEDFSRSDIDALLHTSQATSSRLLKRLVSEGALVQTGEGKRIRYSMAK